MLLTRQKTAAWTKLVALFASCACDAIAHAGAGGPDNLDLAKTVVVGTITDIEIKEEIAGRHGGKMVIGEATIAVSETLKGETAATVTATVISHMDREYAATCAQAGIPVYKAGDSGIWVIVNEDSSNGCVMRPKSSLSRVKKHLEYLENRQWSAPVNGLQAWAALTGERRRSAKFAVKNVAEETIGLPSPLYKGVLTGVVEDENGNCRPLLGVGQPLDRPEPPRVTCTPIEPGEIQYVHPDGINQFYFCLPNDLPSGKYTMRITLANDRPGRTRWREPTQAWQGEVTSPPVIFVKKGNNIWVEGEEYPWSLWQWIAMVYILCGFATFAAFLLRRALSSPGNRRLNLPWFVMTFVFALILWPILLVALAWMVKSRISESRKGPQGAPS